VEDDEGQRTEIHQLVNDRITVKSLIDVPENAPPPEESVMAGIQDAINRFNRQVDGT
jgi:hypothetical protein